MDEFLSEHSRTQRTAQQNSRTIQQIWLSGYPSIKVTANTQQPLTAFFFSFFFALYLGICLLFTKNRWNFSFPIHKWQRENQLALLTNVAIHHFLFYEGGCVQLRAALWGSQLISNHLLVSLPFPAHIFTLKTSLLPSLHLVFSFFSSVPLLHHSSSHTVTSFLLPVRSPWPPPPPGMKCSCSIVFCLLLAKAIRRALGWPVPPWESQPPCMPMPDMVVVLRSCSWPDVGWEFILIMWWRSMDGVTQMFCCDWAFWWWLSRPMVGTIPVPPPRSLVPGSRPIVISRSSRRSGETRSRSWDLETQTYCQCHKSITIFALESQINMNINFTGSFMIWKWYRVLSWVLELNSKF